MFFTKINLSSLGCWIEKGGDKVAGTGFLLVFPASDLPIGCLTKGKLLRLYLCSTGNEYFLDIFRMDVPVTSSLSLHFFPVCAFVFFDLCSNGYRKTYNTEFLVSLCAPPHIFDVFNALPTGHRDVDIATSTSRRQHRDVDSYRRRFITSQWLHRIEEGVAVGAGVGVGAGRD